MINKKQLFSILLTTTGFFGAPQNILANTPYDNVNTNHAQTTTPTLVITADTAKMPANKIHLGYRATMVTNVSDKMITIDSILVNDNTPTIIPNKVMYCAPTNKTFDINNPKYCAYNNMNTTDTCDANHKLQSGKSCFIWFKALQNNNAGIDEKTSAAVSQFTITVKTKDKDIKQNFSVHYEQDLYATVFLKGRTRNVLNYGLFKWDGSKWSPIAEGRANGAALSLNSMKGDLYVGGGALMDMFGGIEVNGIAQWNGSSWSDAGGGVWGKDPTGHTYPGAVSSVAVMNDELYAGGCFNHAGAKENSVEASSNWSPLGSNIMFTDAVYSTSSADKKLYASGLTSPSEIIAAWNGNQWNNVMSGSNLRHHLAGVNNELYASNDNLEIQKLANNSTWKTFGKTSGGGVYALAGTNKEIYIGGSFNSVTGADSIRTPAFSIAKFDLSTNRWISFGNILNDWYSYGNVGSLVNVNNELYVGGEFSSINLGNGNIIPANNVAKWDGYNWSPLGDGFSIEPGTNVSLLIMPSLKIAE
jgi:hypothetical protein